MHDRKKPNWLLWTTALLLTLPVLYVATFGPACRLADRGLLPRVVVRTVAYPLALVAVQCPPEVSMWLMKYGGEATSPSAPPVSREIMVRAMSRVGPN